MPLTAPIHSRNSQVLINTLQISLIPQLEDLRNDGESSCNPGDGMDQRVQSLMFMVMISLIQNFVSPKKSVEDMG
jgi:hypothetical protein